MIVKCLSIVDSPRREIFSKRFNKLCDFDFFNATTPTEFSKKLTPEGMTDGQMCCLLSWRRLCECLLDTEDEYWLVLEDDAIPTDDFDVEHLEEILPDSFDFVQLHHFKSAKTFPFNDNLHEVRPTSFSTVSMVLSRSGAKKYLECKNLKQADLVHMEISVRDGNSFRPKKEMIRHDWGVDSQIKGSATYNDGEVKFHCYFKDWDREIKQLRGLN